MAGLDSATAIEMAAELNSETSSQHRQPGTSEDGQKNSSITIKIQLASGRSLERKFTAEIDIEKARQELSATLNCAADKVTLLRSDGSILETWDGCIKFSNIHFDTEERNTLYVRVDDQQSARAGDQDLQHGGTVICQLEPNTKPFLGGYRDLRRDLEFHNASAQTYKKSLKPVQPDVDRFHRDTQTAWAHDISLQTACDACTQMAKPGIWMSHDTEQLVVSSGRYQTSDALYHKRQEAAILLQRNWRRWLWDRQKATAAEEASAIKHWLQYEHRRRRQARLERRRKVHKSQTSPRSIRDFYVAYNALENWRKNAVDCTHGAKTSESVADNTGRVVCHEVETLKKIENRWGEVTEGKKRQSLYRLLDKCQTSLQWPKRDGQLIEVDTKETIWARSLKQLFEQLCRSRRVPERSDALCAVIAVMNSVPTSKDTSDLQELAQRQLDLLSRGIKVKNLCGLHKRLMDIFCRLLRDPEFNPASGRYQTAPKTSDQMVGGLLQCKSCLKTKIGREFPLDTGRLDTSRCSACLLLRNRAVNREDFNVFMRMLNELRRDEQRRSPDSLACFLLQLPDVRQLVLRVWHGRSCLSAESDLYELALCRWDVERHWSPWNCVLLTREEVDAHYRLADPDRLYGQQLQQKVAARHLAASKHFWRLPEMMQQMQRGAQQLGIDKTPGDTSDCWHTPTPQRLIPTLFVE